MAFDTDAGGVHLRTVGTGAEWCCAGAGAGVVVDPVVGVDVDGSGVHFSNLPFFDICWTKVISLPAPENPGKLVAIAALRLDHPVPDVNVRPTPLGAKANLHCWAVLLLHPQEDVMFQVTRVWGLPVQTCHPQIPAGRDIVLFTVGKGRVTADDDGLAAPIHRHPP